MHRTRAFTLLEVALIVAIIGMMIAIVVGYLLAPKPKGPLPPIVSTPSPFLATPAPATVPDIPVLPTPAPRVPAMTPAPTTAATPAPAQTIDLSPQSSPVFR
jgi:hypothetical protein